MNNFFILAAGGSIGTILRFFLTSLIGKKYLTTFPHGTLLVNLTGCFLIGIFWELFQAAAISEQMKLFLIVGFLGAFTTFSSFSLENLNLIKAGEFRLAFFYIMLSNCLGILLVFAGSSLTRFFLK